MKYNNNTINLPKWISTRTYYFGTEKSRTYINNEKSHKYIQLDGLSSDFWFLLSSDDEGSFYDFLENNNLKEETDVFIEQLSSQGLIQIESEITNDLVYNKTDEDDSCDDEDRKFIEERNDWLMDNNFMCSLFFELTYRCNLKCIHCYNPKNISNVEIPFEKAKEIIDEAYDLGVYSITLSGGESTTHSHFIELVEYIRNKHIALDIFTNGQLLHDDEELYKKVISLYPHQVCLSLYSMNNNEHDYVTDVRGSYNKTFQIINKLRKDNVSVQIKNFLLNTTCESCYEVKRFAEAIGADDIADISLIPTIEGDKKTFKYVIDEETLYKLFINSDSPLFIGENPKTFDYENNKDTSPCLGGFTGVCINPNLDVNICVSLPKPVGNLNNDSLKNIWKGASE